MVRGVFSSKANIVYAVKQVGMILWDRGIAHECEAGSKICKMFSNFAENQKTSTVKMAILGNAA